MKKGQNTDKSRVILVATGLAVVVVAGVVLTKSPKLSGIFSPTNFSQFVNSQQQSEDYSALLGNGDESDLADQNEDGNDSDEEQLQDVTKTARTDRVEEDDEDIDALGISNNNLEESGENTQTQVSLVGLGDTQEENGISVTPTGNTGENGSTDSGDSGNSSAENGDSDQNGGTDNNGNSDQIGGTNNNGTSDEPTVTWEEEQLTPREAVVTEDGTLVSLTVNTPDDWTFCKDDSYSDDGVKVTAVFDNNGKSVEKTLSYGGDDGYSVSMSTKSTGTKTAVFSYGGLTVGRSYTVSSARLLPRYYAWYENTPDTVYSVEFPGDLDDSVWGELWSAVSVSEMYPDADFKVDLSTIHRQMIAYLSNEDIQQTFQEKSGVLSTYAYILYLENDGDGYLTSMLTGFSQVMNNAFVTTDRYIYYPLDSSSKVTYSVVNVNEAVPDGYKIRLRVSGTVGTASYLGDQVLEWYEGDDTVLSVPMGTTVIAMDDSKGTNASVTAISIPESVRSIENVENIANAFPNLKEYQAATFSDGSTSESGSYQVIDGMLFSEDGTTLISVPPATEIDFSTYEWPDTLTRIAKGAFYGCEITSLALPEGVTTLEDGCFENLSANTIMFAGDAPENVGDIEYSGTIFVPDSENDRILKNWQFAFAENGDAIVFGAASETGSAIKGKLGLYGYDGENNVLYSQSDQKKLMAVREEISGSYEVPAGYTSVGGGAFAECENLGEVVFLEISGEWTFDADSLVFSDSVTDIKIRDAGAKISSEAFGDPKEAVLDLAVYVPVEMYADYLESWSKVLDASYGENTAKNLLETEDDTWLYEDGGCYQKITDASGQSGWRLCSLYEKDVTAFAVKDGVLEIAENAFSGCRNLEIVYLTDSVEVIEKDAFSGCISLETVAANSERVAMLSDDVFDNSVVDTVQKLVIGDVYVGFEYEDGILYGLDADGLYTLLNVRTDYCETMALKENTAYLGAYALKDCVNIGSESGNVGLWSGDDSESADQCFQVLTGVEGLRSIAEGCFENMSNLEKVDLSGCTKLTEIGAKAFQNCSALTLLRLPDGVREINDGLCYGCTSLTAVYAGTVSAIGDEAFYDCLALRMTFAQTDESDMQNTMMDWSELTSIGDYAFAECASLTTVILPDTLTHLGESCFENCTDLSEVKLDGTLTAVSRYCFHGCANLKTVEFGEGLQETLTVIGVQAFDNCSALEELDLSCLAGLEKMGQETFSGCSSLIRTELPDSLSAIPTGCFADCTDLSVLTIYGATVPELESGAFGDSFPAFLHIWVEKENVSDYREAYREQLLTEYGKEDVEKIVEAIDETKMILKGVTYQLTDEGMVLLEADPAISGSYTIQEGTTRIADGAFEGCTGLTELHFPDVSDYLDNSISLGDRCFAGCTGLETVELFGNIPEWGEETFAGDTALLTVYFGYIYGTDSYTMIPKIGNRAFFGCTSLQLLYMYGMVDTIGTSCFEDCTGLENLSVSEAFKAGLKTIEDRAFANCTSLKALLTTKYTALETIGDYAFTNCDTLKMPSVPAAVTSIGEGCFSECDNLAYVSFYSSLEEFPDYCFYHCPNLIRTGGVEDSFAGLKRIGKSTYEGCTSLVQSATWYLERYMSLEEIDENAFKGCKSLTVYTDSDENECETKLSSTVTKIGAGAFDGCTGLTNLYLQSETPPAIGTIDVSSLSLDFTLRVPDSESSGDSVYLAYLSVLEQSMSAEDALAILDSATDGAKARYQAAQTPDSESLWDVESSAAVNVTNEETISDAADSVTNENTVSDAADNAVNGETASDAMNSTTNGSTASNGSSGNLSDNTVTNTNSASGSEESDADSVSESAEGSTQSDSGSTGNNTESVSGGAEDNAESVSGSAESNTDSEESEDE